MRRLQRILGIGGLFCLFVMMSAQAEQKVLGVQIKEGQLRSQPSFLGKIVATVAYGAAVTVIEEKGEWFNVTATTPAATGWIHASALTKKAVNLNAGQDVSSVAESELVIAGKGFNQQVEQEFQQKHKDIDFQWIDRMVSTFVVTPEAQRQFLEKGNLTPEGGSL
jgi:hypothetical protein